MRKINKKTPGSVILGSEIASPVRETITSGSLNFDVALGGGWATNHWNEIVGHASAGKTMITLKMIAANQKLDPNWTAIWFAAEDFVDTYAEMMGVDLTRVIVEEENTMEAVYEHAIWYLDTKGVDCMVIDSLPALVPAREDDATMEDFQPGLAAFLTGKFFRKSNPSMKRSMTEVERPCTGFVVNQWRQKVGVRYGDPRTTPGGMAKDFFCFQRVDIKRDEWIKNTKNEPIGQVLKLVNVKNKYARPGRIGMIDAYFSKGNGFEAGDYDLVKDIVSAALAHDIIIKDKANYLFGEQSWYGRPRLDEAIATDKKLRGAVSEAVMTAATSPLPPPVQLRPKKAAPKKRVARGRAS